MSERYNFREKDLRYFSKKNKPKFYFILPKIGRYITTQNTLQLLFILYTVDGGTYIHCCDCESTNLSFGLSSLTTGDVFSFQSSIMIMSLVNR